jgi:hypothetical protein
MPTLGKKAKTPGLAALAATNPKVARTGGEQTKLNREERRRLDMALGKPENLSAYRDCVQGARIGWRSPLVAP